MANDNNASQFGRFEDHSPQELLNLINWLAEGFERDAASRFDGYVGAKTGLCIARAFLILGDCPEANEEATTGMGDFAEYALDSMYWTADGSLMVIAPDDAEECWRPTLSALIAIRHYSRRIWAQHQQARA